MPPLRVKVLAAILLEVLDDFLALCHKSGVPTLSVIVVDSNIGKLSAPARPERVLMGPFNLDPKHALWRVPGSANAGREVDMHEGLERVREVFFSFVHLAFEGAQLGFGSGYAFVVVTSLLGQAFDGRFCVS